MIFNILNTHDTKEEKDQREIQLKETLTKLLDRKEPNNEPEAQTKITKVKIKI